MERDVRLVSAQDDKNKLWVKISGYQQKHQTHVEKHIKKIRTFNRRDWENKMRANKLWGKNVNGFSMSLSVP